MTAETVLGSVTTPQKILAGPNDPIRAVDTPTPEHGKCEEIAPGVWWARLPIGGSLENANIYLLVEEGGFTLVDCGTNSQACRDALQQILQQEPFRGLSLKRVLVTHHHPDHIGQAGNLAANDVRLVCSRLCWTQARLAWLDDRPRPNEEEIAFAQQAGLDGLAMAAYQRSKLAPFRSRVDHIPSVYEPIGDGDQLQIGSRTWRILVGNGHAAGHLTLWSDDGIGITGDQILPNISSNLSVFPSEYGVDLLDEWITSCSRILEFADNNFLCLPGHGMPFRGIQTRCQQIIRSHEAALKRLHAALATPKKALDCLQAIYLRTPAPHESSNLLAECVGYLNHLRQSGLAKRHDSPDGVHVWQRSSVAFPERKLPEQTSR